MINLSSFIRFHARRTPEAIAIVYEDARISYAEFEERILRLAALLEDYGIRPGDVVAALMKNSPGFLELAFASSHIGAIFLPINFRLAADEVAYMVDNSGAGLLVVDEELAGAAALVRTQVVGVDASAQKDMRALGAPVRLAAACPCRPDDIFRLMYTSGTTDRPKGVVHRYSNFYWKCSDHVVVLAIRESTRLLVAGPLYHVGAFDLPGVAVLWQGGRLAILREFSPRDALALIESERLTGAWLAPVMTTALLTFEERNRYDVSSLEWVVGGGERTPESRIRSFSDFFRGARYIDAYGLTESCSGDTFMETGRELEKIGSTGRATPHVEISIRDDDGRPLPSGQAGEVCLRGPKIFSGYWQDPEKTAASFIDGWFRTGDVGHLDEEGFLFLTDRKKDMIISGGENIASSEVERVLQMIPDVMEAAVVGVPHERWGEVPVAFLVAAGDAAPRREAILEHCRTKLAGFKVPKKIIFRRQLPRNASGKLLKRQLREELGREVEEHSE